MIERDTEVRSISGVEKHMRIYPSRQWFQETRGWKPWAVMLVTVAVVIALFVALQGGAATARGADPMLNPPSNAAGFVTHFKAGDYNRTQHRIKYSRAFRKMYLHLVRRHAASHPRYTPCPGTGNFGCIWPRWTHHDSCVSSLPDTFDWNSCSSRQEEANWNKLFRSRDWKARSATYNKWTARIVWCGTVGFILFRFGATSRAAFGGGASTCLGGRLVK
jgi:hypothetical protein